MKKGVAVGLQVCQSGNSEYKGPQARESVAGLEN
jgi:hypothetical protein